MERFDENDGVWRTMDNGQKIFIRKGENFRDAYKRRLGEGNNKSLRSIVGKSNEGNSSSRRNKILRKAYKAEQAKIESELDTISKAENEREMDYEGRKIRITGVGQGRELTREEQAKKDKLEARLKVVRSTLDKLK